MGGKSAPSYTPGESDKKWADWLDYQTVQAKDIYANFQKPEMERAQANTQQMQAMRPGFVSWLSPEYQQQLQAGTVPAAATGAGVNPGQFGLGQTAAAPILQQFTAAPDWQAAGQQYAATQNTANLLGLDQQLRSAANSGAANLALRGMQNSSLAPTQQQALQNWANVQRAQSAGDTLLRQQALEAGLRGEANAITSQNQANQWKQAAWDQAQQDASKADMWNVMNYLQGGTVPTMQAQVDQNGISSGLQGQVQRDVDMWKQQVQDAQANRQMWADIISTGASIATGPSGFIKL